MTTNIDVRGLPREALLIIAERACYRLTCIANMLTTDEGDPADTEEEFGLSVGEVIEGAHDNMIYEARSTLDSIAQEFLAQPRPSEAATTAASDPGGPP